MKLSLSLSLSLYTIFSFATTNWVATKWWNLKMGKMGNFLIATKSFFLNLKSGYIWQPQKNGSCWISKCVFQEQQKNGWISKWVVCVLDNNKKKLGLEVHSPWPSSFGSLVINQHGLIAIWPQPIYYYYSSCCSQCFILMKIWATTRLPKVKPKKKP